MRALILALGVGVATLGSADTASAGPPRGHHGGHASFNRGWYGNHHGNYGGFGRGYYSGYGSPPYRAYGYPGYGYGFPGYGYGYQPGFSVGVQGPRGGTLGFTINP